MISLTLILIFSMCRLLSEHYFDWKIIIETFHEKRELNVPFSIEIQYMHTTYFILFKRKISIKSNFLWKWHNKTKLIDDIDDIIFSSANIPQISNKISVHLKEALAQRKHHFKSFYSKSQEKSDLSVNGSKDYCALNERLSSHDTSFQWLLFNVLFDFGRTFQFISVRSERYLHCLLRKKRFNKSSEILQINFNFLFLLTLVMSTQATGAKNLRSWEISIKKLKISLREIFVVIVAGSIEWSQQKQKCSSNYWLIEFEAKKEHKVLARRMFFHRFCELEKIWNMKILSRNPEKRLISKFLEFKLELRRRIKYRKKKYK